MCHFLDCTRARSRDAICARYEALQRAIILGDLKGHSTDVLPFLTNIRLFVFVLNEYGLC